MEAPEEIYGMEAAAQPRDCTPLLRSAAIQDALLDLSETFHAILDPSGCIREMTGGWELLTHVPSCEVVGRPLATLLVKGDDSLFERTLLDANRILAPVRCEVRVSTPPAGFRWMEFKLRGIETPEGLMIGAVGRDRTDARIREDAIQRGETHYRALIEQMPGVLYRKAAGGFLLASSARIESLTGYSPAELRRNPDLWSALIHPEDRDRVARQMRQGMMAGEGYRIEYRIIDRSQQVRWILDECRPLPGDSSICQGILLEVTELREAEERLQLGIWGGDLALWDWHPARGVICGNAKLWDLAKCTPSSSELPFEKFLQAIHPDDRERVMKLLEQHCTSESGDFDIEHRLSTPSESGLERWVHARGRVVCRGADGRALRFSGTWQDTSAIRQAEEQRRSFEKNIQETQRLESLGLLAGGIAHDFNNLLTVIHGHADLALVNLPKDSKVRPSVERIAQTVTRMAELTNQMLAYSGRGKFVIRKIDLNAFVRETTDFLKVSITKRAALEFDLARNAPWVEADIAQTRQVLLNLITNASEALPKEGGRIRVRTGVAHLTQADLIHVPWHSELTPGNFAFFEVEDNGSGMSPETVKRIFEPFFTTKFTGRGLGLSAVQGIVRSHHGFIDLKSELGRGTTFRVHYPTTADTPAPTEAKDGANGIKAARTNQRILVIDDEESLQAVLGGFLAALGFSYDSALDGPAAVNLVRENPDAYAGVLLDLTMPRMSGVEVLAELRQISETLPVIIMSGYAEQEVGRLVSDGRCTGFLSKPFRLRQLAEKLSECLPAPQNCR
jgi:PAS domain S-box-containing protein